MACSSRAGVGSNKEVLALVRAALRQGWSVEKRGSGHLAFRPPGGQMIITPSSPKKDRRTILNIRAALRRAGLGV